MNKTLSSNELHRVLVTGGAGMIGRRVVDGLTREGVEVAVLDNLANGLPMPTANARAVPGDIRDAGLVGQLCRSFRPDAIVHLAAVHHIPTCEAQRAHALEVNVVGTENVLCAAEAAGVARVTIASSGAVYAWEDGALVEDGSALCACDNYALAKTTNESQLRFWTERSGGMGRVARIFNTIAHDDPNAHLIPDITAQLTKGRGQVTIRLGNLLPKRDYIHADDVAAGLIAVLRDSRTQVAYDVFNLCSGVERSVEELVREMSSLLDRDLCVESDPQRTRRTDRLSQLGDPRKATHVLGWTAQIPFAAALQRTLGLRG